MTYYLVQHGKAHPKEIDHYQGLTTEGVQETQQMATLLRNKTIGINAIWHIYINYSFS